MTSERPGVSTVRRVGGIWWRPDRLAWWIGVLFAIGSVLFLVPAVAALGSSPDWIPARVDVLAAAVQFPGTILFNVNTWNASRRASAPASST